MKFPRFLGNLFPLLMCIACSNVDLTKVGPPTPSDPQSRTDADYTSKEDFGSGAAPITLPSSTAPLSSGATEAPGDVATQPPVSERPAMDVDAGANAATLPFPPTLQLHSSWRAVDAFPNLTFTSPTFLAEAPSTGHLFVAQQTGEIYAFRNSSDVRDATLVLDLSATTQAGNDCGLLGFAFHPEFGQPGSPSRGYVYVQRSFKEIPIQPEGAPVEPFTPTLSRMSRFTVDLSTMVADRNSELVLIDQYDENLVHLGAAMFFGPQDGFLYVSVGDEGHYECDFGNCQRIDKDLFSGVLRIDVDCRGGDVSHAIPRQPETGITGNYCIPNDNPFVGELGVLEEFYALGLRSPHRMTHDPIDRLTLIGDVGQFAVEELDVLAPGANFQWNVLEGSVTGSMAMPASPVGVWTDPVLELQREDATAIIGGYVYRGARFPELWGKYIFGDFGRGSVWALSYTYDGARFDVVDRSLLFQREFRITSFGVDASGEVYLLLFGANHLQRIERSDGTVNVPRALSQTSLFQGPNQPSASGALPYEVRVPLWGDGAVKRRWLILPPDAHVTFADVGPWTFPSGTIFAKQFSMALDERNPSRLTPLETRFLVKGEHEYYGISYKWNALGTDADLLRERRDEQLSIIQADGSVRQQRYVYPSPSDCLTCHNPAAGYVLGARTAQLNGELFADANEHSTNQLLLWAALGIFGDSLPPDVPPGALEHYPRLAPLGDESKPLGDRVRSYWDSNCSMCHGVLSGIRAAWDARYLTPLAQQRVIFGQSLSNNDPNSAVIWPGAPERSILFQRSSTTDPNQKMPPLGRNRIDAQYVDVLERWIRSLDLGPN